MQFLRIWRHQRVVGLYKRALIRFNRIAARRYGVAILGGALLSVLCALWAVTIYTLPGPSEEPRLVLIGEGASVRKIARQLEEAGVLDGQLAFVIASRLTGQHRNVQAGEYEFPAGVSVRGAIRLMVSGDTYKRRLTIAEGLTTQESLDIIRATEGLTGEISQTPGEGTLLPQTYYFSWGDNREELIRRMQQALTEVVDELWEKRAPGLAVASKREALILASIVEKETGIEAERRRVAGVFHNRLRKRMRLQSDPTVAYAVTGGQRPLGRPLSRRDLNRKHPYNTYAIYGLPPGPIANPGRASLEAALNPLPTQDLYFVADGTGGHVFAPTLKEHEENVKRWRRIQRQRKRAENGG